MISRKNVSCTSSKDKIKVRKMVQTDIRHKREEKVINTPRPVQHGSSRTGRGDSGERSAWWERGWEGCMGSCWEAAAAGAVLLQWQSPVPRLVPLISAQQQIGPFFMPSCCEPPLVFLVIPLFSRVAHATCPVWERSGTCAANSVQRVGLGLQN